MLIAAVLALTGKHSKAVRRTLGCPGLGGCCGDDPVTELAPGMNESPIYCFLTAEAGWVFHF